MIASLEAEQAEQGNSEPRPTGEQVQPPQAPVRSPELDQVNLEIRNLKTEIGNVKQKMAEYQQRVEDTPKREQEMTAVIRDYDNLRDLYKSLLDRKLEAEIAVSMEKKQKGEQFRVLDPAKRPQRPVSPNLPKTLLMSFVLALGVGGGIAYLVEMMDTSFRRPEEIEKECKVPVLLSIPVWQTEESLGKQKRRSVLVAASVAAAFILSAVGIVFATKGIDAVGRLVKSLLGTV